jgi:hypothetical protein
MYIMFFGNIHPPLLSYSCLRPPLPKQSPFYFMSLEKKSRFHMWEKTWYLSFWVWLILLDMMISGSIHFPANDIIHSSLWLKNTLLSIYSTLLLEPLHQSFLVKGFFKIRSGELFAWAGLEPWSSWSLPS